MTNIQSRLFEILSKRGLLRLIWEKMDVNLMMTGVDCFVEGLYQMWCLGIDFSHNSHTFGHVNFDL